jgi:hypothetical protein
VGDDGECPSPGDFVRERWCRQSGVKQRRLEVSRHWKAPITIRWELSIAVGAK